MPSPKLILLTNGGVRSLVTTAMVFSWPEPADVVLLHVRRGQPAASARLRCVRRQAGHFGACSLVEVEEPALAPPRGKRGVHPNPAADLPLANTRLLTTAMVQAALLDASRIIWPISFNGEFSAMTRAMEQMVLVRHLAAAEMSDPPAIESPMIELTGRQIIELGATLRVRWDLAWSCDVEGEQPCGACSGCRRRSAAFDAAGIEDPSEQPVGGAVAT